MNLAWNPQRWPKEKIPAFTRLWAKYRFGPEYAGQIADILSQYTKYNGRRKPEFLSPDTLSLVNYRRVHRVLADWSRALKGHAHGGVTISGAGAEPVVVNVNEFNPGQPTRSSLKRFVEADGYVSIEAVHFTKKIDAASARWEEISNLGRTLSAMSIFPVTAPSVTPPNNSLCLKYKMNLFHPVKVEVEAIVDPALNFIQGRGLHYALKRGIST